jgi:hypothetical protein
MNALTFAALTLMTAAPSVDASAPEQEPVRSDGARARFGIGTFGMVGTDQGLPTLGLSLQLGAQINDAWAVYAQLQGSSLLFIYNVGSAALMVERTFGNIVSVGTGVGYITSSRHILNWDGFNAQPDPFMQGVQVPLRVQFNFGPQPTGASRNRFFVAAEAATGVVQGNETNGLIFSTGVCVGYALM